ncbi:hypothetical protein GCM10010170_086230 [Dactylosporangium salmoneum]|uniref:Transposase n=1 Tax=Dactylosporangium salmoneum TaxID=53361 RepID=A0ABP5UHT5_9ACTN
MAAPHQKFEGKASRPVVACTAVVLTRITPGPEYSAWRALSKLRDQTATCRGRVSRSGRAGIPAYTSKTVLRRSRALDTVETAGQHCDLPESALQTATAPPGLAR